jgi:hypothetical protein
MLSHRKLYVKKFGVDNYEIRKTCEFSSYIPQPMRDAIDIEKKNHLIETDYIICPLYKSGDIQIGVTGSLKLNEIKFSANHNQAESIGIYRELSEEIGIHPKNSEKINKIYEDTCKGKKYVIFSLYLGNSEIVDKIYNNYVADVSADDKQKKIGCIVYGSEEIVKDVFSKPFYRLKDKDDIVGVVAVPVELIFSRLQKIV